MSRREALRATALVAARASIEAQITMAEACTAADAVCGQRHIDTRITAYRAALGRARTRAARA